MINILFIHQSAELYGSDKTLLFLLKYLDKSKFNPIVILPSKGPLVAELEKLHVVVFIAPVLKLHRKMFTPKNIFLFFKEIRNAFAILDELNAKYRFDIIYSNTLAVLLGILYAKKRNIKHLWHIHEIIEKPKFLRKCFGLLMALKANTKIVYNSIATQNFWDTNAKIKNKSVKIWNGLETTSEFLTDTQKKDLRKNLFHAENEIIIALIGRINQWKGHYLLLNAFRKILDTHQDVKLLFVGSPPPNQTILQQQLQSEIKKFQLEDKVTIIPFQEQIGAVWQTIDIAVVPSIEPEPFGLVAVEAMLAKKPVVAANHGGLTEIVVHEETGYLFVPSDEKSLTAALLKLINDREKSILLGEKGYKRAIEEFSVQKYAQNFEKLFLMLSNNDDSPEN